MMEVSKKQMGLQENSSAALTETLKRNKKECKARAIQGRPLTTNEDTEVMPKTCTATD